MKNLTLRYSLTQFSFWAASTGAASFAATYLLNNGVAAGNVGTLLAAAGLLSCLTQPILAGIADRARHFWLIKMLVAMSTICAACFFIQLTPNLSIIPMSICYMIGIWSSNAMVSLVNALYVSYTQEGYTVNYGAARGIGSAASAISSLILGHVIAQMGDLWMIVLLIAFRMICIITLLGYPRIQKQTTSSDLQDNSCSVRTFIIKYPQYCLSLLGIMFLGMYHAMTENYMIAILGRLGGNSSHVGTALFISSMVGAPVIFFFQSVRKRLSDTKLLKIAACSFLLKAVLFNFAQSIAQIYCFQLLQITSYAFLAPTQVYYAQAKVQHSDMVKGQAFSTAAYALGCSAGNFLGGQLLQIGVQAIVTAGIAIALLGTIILFATVDHTEQTNIEIR